MGYPTSLSWATQTSAANVSWYGVSYSPTLDLFCAVAGTGTANRVMTSPDGTTWTTQTTAPDLQWNDICWADSLGLFVAVAGGGVSGRVMTSPDGVNWTLRTSNTATHAWYGVAWSASLGLLVAVGGSGTSTDRCMTSADGITWTLRTTPTGATYSNWVSVAWSSSLGLFCAVADNGTYRCMTSPDGINWTERSIDTSKYWNDIEWSPTLGLFAAVGGDAGYGATTSPDGINWTNRATSGGNNWQGIVWVSQGDFFVAVANSGTGNRVMSSDDGVTWTSRTSAADNSWMAVCHSPTDAKVIAVASSGVGNRVMSLGPLPIPLNAGEGLLTVTGLTPALSFIVPMIKTATMGLLSITGLQAKHSNFVVWAQSQQGDLLVNGQMPAVQLGISLSPVRAQIQVAGQSTGFINRQITAVKSGWLKTRYLCRLIDSAGLLPDLVLPISSLQIRYGASPFRLYLSVVVPGVDQYIDQINARNAGTLVVDRLYDYLDTDSQGFEMARVAFDTFSINQGGIRGATGQLSGFTALGPVTAQTLQLFDATGYGSDNGRRRYRCRIDPRLRPLDTAQIDGQSIIVGDLIYIIDTQTSIMEVQENA